MTGNCLFGMLSRREAAACWRPRPPGALDRERFSAACARCGRCVAACPYDVLRLSSIEGPVPLGTPYFIPRESPCRMCQDLPCVKACPTGALDADLTDVRKARMGVAVIDPNACLSWQGLRCEVCFRECPENGRALTIEAHPRGLSAHTIFTPVIHPEACTGCGLCEKGCPTDVPSVRVADPDAVLGVIGRHYRLGWLPTDDPKNTRRQTSPAAPDGDAASRDEAALDYLNDGEP